MKSLHSAIQVLEGDITKFAVDCIVNAANTSLLGGGGVDGAIHRAGGPAILADCRKIIARQGGCKVGEAVITTAGDLPSKFVIHTVGPVWNGGDKDERIKLASCYRNSLQLAVDNGCRSIAFPNISTGIYKFPKEEAARIAVDTVLKYVSKSDQLEMVVFVCFDEENFHFTKDQLVLKYFTIPSKLYAGADLLGTVKIGLEDEGQGVLSGQFIPNDNYNKYRSFLRNTLRNGDRNSLMAIAKFTQENQFNVIADDGTDFKQPVGGLIVYDFEKDPIIVELNRIDYEIWKKYFS
jgi:O-acetyl-ADP-ribose deacetylase (regulator of RNase III)